MINLLFNNTIRTNQNPSSISIKSKVVEIVLFDIHSGYSKAAAEKALSSLNDIIKLYYGFIERITASNGEGKYIDIVYWTDMQSAKDAATDIMNSKKATEIFTIINRESIKMYHFNTFNQFEE
ncbi:hypothetical protein [Aquimarina longa]|uniref:hypothetical protein n=1 Tax=Aquimarina longa TaxID=1080221 RepID=UPI000783EA96|nr:hypothetical protein [Aquimarina longa]